MARRYGELAVFPEDTEVPVSVVRRLWHHTGGLDDDESRTLLRDLERKGLLYLSTDGADESLSFHDRGIALGLCLTCKPGLVVLRRIDSTRVRFGVTDGGDGGRLCRVL